MKVCTFPNCAYLSETSRMIAIFKELKSRGVPVVMATHGGPYLWLIEEEQIPFEIVEPVFTDQRARDFVATNTGEGGLGGLEFYERAELREHVENEISFYRSQGVTKVVTGFTLSCALSARVENIPYVVTHLGSFVPPVFERKMLVPTLISDSLLTKIIPEAWLVSLINGMMFKSGIATKNFNKIGRELGLPKFHSMEELMMGDLNIVTDVPKILTIPKQEMENWVPTGKNRKYYSFPMKIRYGGALFAKLFGDVSDEVKNFLQTDKPKIYIALTSGRAEVLERVYEAVSVMEVKAVICTTLHSFSQKSGGNILVAHHLPSHKIMPLTDLAIIHGGQGSVQTAIDAGIPIIGIPLHVEQGLNVSMVERHGAGLLQGKHDIKPEDIRRKVNLILQNPEYHQNMQKLSEFQSQVDGVTAVTNLILE